MSEDTALVVFSEIGLVEPRVNIQRIKVYGRVEDTLSLRFPETVEEAVTLDYERSVVLVAIATINDEDVTVGIRTVPVSDGSSVLVESEYFARLSEKVQKLYEKRLKAIYTTVQRKALRDKQDPATLPQGAPAIEITEDEAKKYAKIVADLNESVGKRSPMVHAGDGEDAKYFDSLEPVYAMISAEDRTKVREALTAFMMEMFVVV